VCYHCAAQANRVHQRRDAALFPATVVLDLIVSLSLSNTSSTHAKADSNSDCGAGNCTSNCDRKSECNPGWPSGFAVMEKCPLNVCCSKWGNCGTTAQFCGENKVKRPACTGGNLMRAVGYYEGWSIRRPCGRFSPERLPLGIYTHINFAFATIDPETFTIRPANTEDIPLYTRLTDLKQEDPQLNVFIAIGEKSPVLFASL